MEAFILSCEKGATAVIIGAVLANYVICLVTLRTPQRTHAAAGTFFSERLCRY